MRTSNEEDLDLEAARLTLVALFAFVPPYESVDDRHVRIAPESALLSIDSAARFMASMPKPLICAADRVGITLRVTCELLAAASEFERDMFTRRLKSNTGDGELFDSLADAHGENEHSVLVISGTRSLLVSLAGARRWYRDYIVDFIGWRADDVRSAPAADDAQYSGANRQGASGILQFFSPADHLVTTDGTSVPFPLPDSATSEERRKLERAMIERARSRLVSISQEDDIAAVEQSLVERAEIPADAIGEYLRDRDSFGDQVLSSQMQQFFRDRAMPPEVAAFVDACRVG
ncbi:MAG: hypothetical protein ABI889_10385 [Gemmatimonadota bacterium]